MSPADDDWDVPDTSELRTGHEPVDALLAELRAELRREPVPAASVALARMLSEGFTAPSPAGLVERVGALGLAAKAALAGGVVAVGVATAGGAIALPGGPALDDTVDAIVPGGDDEDGPPPSVPAAPTAHQPGSDVPGTTEVPGLLTPDTDASGPHSSGTDAPGNGPGGPPPGLESGNPAAPAVPPDLGTGDPEPPTGPPGLERPGAPAPGPPATIPSVDFPAGPPPTIPSKAPATGPPTQAKKPVS